MPKARRKKERIMQIGRWLAAKYPCAYPVKIKIMRLPDEVGACERNGKHFNIFLDDRTKWELMAMVLIHEWAHARSWRHEVIERTLEFQHDEEWGITFAKIYRDFVELDGCEEANEY